MPLFPISPSFLFSFMTFQTRLRRLLASQKINNSAGRGRTRGSPVLAREEGKLSFPLFAVIELLSRTFLPGKKWVSGKKRKADRKDRDRGNTSS